jgi:uncharacterized repeat protein (TIGR01451 family)
MRALLFLLFAICSLLIVAPALAQQTPNCQPIFGGGPSCVQEGDLTLDKKVRNPVSNQYVENMGINDPKFSPNQQVLFQVNVRNKGSRAIEDVSVTDTFPQYVSFIKGPGQFDRSTNTITFSIDKLEAGQSRTVTIEGKIAQANAIPGTTGIACVVNQAAAIKGRHNASDNTQFCLQKTGQDQTPGQWQAQPTAPQANTNTAPSPTKAPMPVYDISKQQTVPKTGPEMLALIGLIPAGAAGIFLRRKTSTNG